MTRKSAEITKIAKYDYNQSNNNSILPKNKIFPVKKNNLLQYEKSTLMTQKSAEITNIAKYD